MRPALSSLFQVSGPESGDGDISCALIRTDPMYEADITLSGSNREDWVWELGIGNANRDGDGDGDADGNSDGTSSTMD